MTIDDITLYLGDIATGCAEHPGAHDYLYLGV